MMATPVELGSKSAHGKSHQKRGRILSCLSSVLVAAIVICAAHRPAQAVPINYGSHVGTTVDYLNVTEDTTTGDTLPLFGAPIFSADSIDFNPVGFDATASGTGDSDTTGARLTFMIMAHAGKSITNINFSEAGDTTLGGIGNDSTSTSVTASGTITVNAVDGVNIAPLVTPIALTFTPSGGTYGLMTDGAGGPIFHTPWTGSLLVNVGQILTQAGVPFTFGASKVSIDLVNTLSAATQTGTAAVISKKDFGGISITVNIPEPTSVVLASAAFLGSVGFLFRRRRG
jgi:hypothetical protein